MADCDIQLPQITTMLFVTMIQKINNVNYVYIIKNSLGKKNKLKNIIERIIFVIPILSIGACATYEEIKPDKQAVPKHQNTEQSQNARGTEGLDLLKNYDKDLWSGPDGWTEEQWAWKKHYDGTDIATT